MKVAHVVDSISRDAGGVFFSVNSLTLALSGMDIELSIHGLRDQHADRDKSSWEPLNLRIHKTRGPRNLGYSSALTNALLQADDDLLHVHGVWQAQSFSVHSWHVKTGHPYLISPHGMLDPWALAQSRWKKRLAAWCYETTHLRDAACLHALSASEADSIRAYGLKNPICRIPNGVALPRVTGHCSGVTDQENGELVAAGPVCENQNFRFSAFQQTAPRVLLFLGRLHPKKGLVNALRAWKKVMGHGSRVTGKDEWQFVIAGWDQGGHLAELKHLCTELGLSYANGQPPTANGPPPTVLFTGPVFGDSKDALLRRADAFILPSFSEGLPMAVLEAWAYELPVLMTEHCNLPEGFAAGAAIRIGTNVESIAEGLKELLLISDSGLQSLGKAGRTLVEQQFTWRTVAAQIEEVYEWMLGGGEKPGTLV